jgi:hypothetical protein
LLETLLTQLIVAGFDAAVIHFSQDSYAPGNLYGFRLSPAHSAKT